ncbi:MAG: hypothetical protein H7Y11_00435, partial [Armatimonadetes bacterium]|nr:hypothetical protein [Anaerolineae bacterium]
IDRILAGEGKISDIDLIANVAKNMQGTTLCALGEFAANPIIHTIRNFPDDFKQHIDPQTDSAVVAAKPGGRAGGTARRAEPAPAGD